MNLMEEHQFTKNQMIQTQNIQLIDKIAIELIIK